MGAEAVVVGGGAIGVACAHFLAGAGFEVTLVERGEVGRGCSFANAGLITASYPQPLPGPGVVREGLAHLAKRDGPFYIKPSLDAGLARWMRIFLRSCGAETQRRSSEALLGLCRASLDLYEDLAREGKAEFPYSRGPLLAVYLSEDWESRVQADVDDHAALGLDARGLDRDEILEMEPGLGSGVRGGVLFEEQAWGDCFVYVRSLATGLGDRGVRVIEGVTAGEVVVERGRAEGVTAGDEEIPADIVVLAAGAWTPQLAAPLGLRLPIQPATGYSSTFAGYDGAPRIPIMVEERHVIVTPLGGRLRFAGTLELAGFRTSPDPVRARAVVRGGREVLPEDVSLQGEESWHGFRPLTADDLPVIGWVPGMEGAIVAAGHGTLGFTQSPITGKLVAELASGETPSVPLEPFRPDRF